MKKTKTRLELFSFYDHCGISAHLERQAREGWMLEKIGSYGWTYRRIEPQDIKFYVTYYPKASAYDPGPSEQEQIFRDYCENAGWKLAAAGAQMQIFYCDEAEPIPIETDAVMQVENIHCAAKRSTIFSHILLAVLGLMQMAMWLIDFFRDPVSVLSDYTAWFRWFCWANLLSLCAVELISYFLWHRKAVRIAEDSGTLYPTRSHRLFQSVSVIATFSALVLWTAFMQSPRMKVMVTLAYGYMIVLLIAVNGCRLLLKKWKVSTNTNRVITILVDVVLAFGMMGLMTWGVIKMDIPDRHPVDTYEYLGRTREVYADELPVSVEDLMKVTVSGYSKQLTVKETLLAAVYNADQTERHDLDLDQPAMDYRLAISRIPAWTNWFWSGWINEYPRHGVSLVEADPTPWGAEEAYRELFGVDLGYTWYIRWEDRFVRLTAYWELTEAQMEIIAYRILAWQEVENHEL